MNELASREAIESIAIIGLSGRFPGSRSVEEFWEHLCAGRELITHFSEQELAEAGIPPDVLQHPRYVKARGMMPDVEWFDPAFFGFTPREAEVMDPQQRLFLECIWEALEGAGYHAEGFPGKIGVFAGTSFSTYLLYNLYPNARLFETIGDFQILLENDKDHLTTWAAYRLNLKGPCVTVQTACSTSLVAVHLACQSLLTYECDMALAGGVSIGVPQQSGYLYQEGGINAPDGHCRTFDAQAQGTVSGSGAGVVLLKRLDDALAAGDHILAVIKGSAINNDGSLKVGYTAPSVAGQAEVIANAHATAGVSADTIGYVEAHGTGTALGDPIEIAALTQAFRDTTAQRGYCAIGSAKTNVGHLDSAAGVTGLIKATLALYHEVIPPSLHFERPNPQIDFEGSPFYVATQLTQWAAGQVPRRAGVSSFGIGGTNAHVVLEEAPRVAVRSSTHQPQVVVLSARSRSALEVMTDRLVQYVQAHNDLSLADVAYTLQVGRKAFPHRRMVVCHDCADAAQVLAARDPDRVVTHLCTPATRSLAFLFPGQGAQYVRMGWGLYQHEPVFRAHVDRCATFLTPRLGYDIRTVLYPPAGAAPPAVDLEQTEAAQPALFVVGYALAQVWMAWGVQPQALIGHSIGEYVAACLAGVFSLEDALALVAARARLVQQLPTGAMLSVPLSEAEVLPLLGTHLALAAVNAPALCVVAGPVDAIDALQAQLVGRGVACSRLHVSHAFHSPIVDGILEPFTAEVRRVRLQRPQIPYLSNVSGTWITDEEATDPGYWATHLRQTVRFGDGMRTLLADEDRVLLEVGPGQMLSALARQQLERPAERAVIASLRHPNHTIADEAFVLGAIGQLWLAGIAIDWQRFAGDEVRQRVSLPTYPFERQRCWVDPPLRSSAPQVAAVQRATDLADWFYAPIWKQSMLPDGAPLALKSWLIFLDGCGVGQRLAAHLVRAGAMVQTVAIGERFARISEGVYTIDPGAASDYQALLSELRQAQRLPEVIAHLWNVTGDEQEVAFAGVDSVQTRGLYSLVFLAQAIGEHAIGAPLRIGVISDGLQDVRGDEVLCPAKATLLGPCQVIPQEYPTVHCRSIDVALTTLDAAQLDALARQVIAELLSPATDPVVAYRHRHRWVHVFEPRPLARRDGAVPLRDGGVYVITGGFEGLGLELAGFLAQTVHARLALVGDAPLLHGEQWRMAGQLNGMSEIAQRLLSYEAAGGQVMTFCADPSDRAQMRGVFDEVRRRYGRLHGVIHAAGVLSAGAIQFKTPGMIAQVIRPKVHGAMVLAEVLASEPLDFLALCSSVIGVAGGVGQVDYTAANAFLDAFAQAHPLGCRVFSIGWGVGSWDMWQSVAGGGAGVLQQFQQQRDVFDIRPAEAVEIFRRVLACSLPWVIASTQDIQTVIAQTGKVTLPSASEAGAAKPVARDGSYVAARDELEQTIVDIWQDLFGIASIGVYDNFFDLGGHSLSALQLISRLRDVFQVELPINSLFETPNVAGLAKTIAEKQIAVVDADEIALLLQRIEGLSPDELAAELAAASITVAPPVSVGQVASTPALPGKAAKEMVLGADDRPTMAPPDVVAKPTKKMQFSVFFFSDDGSTTGSNKYQLLIESAKFADRHGFTAIWTPERHFQHFGGLYPNPSVLSAAIAMITERIAIRSGSVVLPLHHPIRVAEEWSVVDNLSNGRAELSFATGWHPRDFVFAPQAYEQRRQITFDNIEVIRKLWAGESVMFPDGSGEVVALRLLPRPIQPAIPMWLTSSNSLDTWAKAGELGTHVLTAFPPDVEVLAHKVSVYREALAQHGHDPRAGRVAVMLHTYLGADLARVKETTRAPMAHYLQTYMLQTETAAPEMRIDAEHTTEEDKAAIAAFAFEHYFRSMSLLGTVDKCRLLVDRLASVDVDEIACLIDFGLDTETVLEGLHYLDALQSLYR